MKNVNYRQMSLEDLKSKAKSAQISLSLLIGIIIVQIGVGAYLTLNQGFSVFTVMPIIFIPIAIISSGNLKKLKQEIAARENQ